MKDKLCTAAAWAVVTLAVVGAAWGALIVLDRLLKLTGWW